MTEELKVPALTKAMQIINFIAKRKKCYAREILNETKISRSSMYTIINDLINHGLIRQNGDGAYMLWTKFIELGNVANEGLDLGELVRPHLQTLMEETHSLSVYFGVIDNDKGYFLEKLSNEHMAIRTKAIVGAQVDFVHAGIGKALLANLPDEKIQAIMPTLDFTPITAHSILTPELLYEEIAKIRKRGWSFNDSEDDECMRSIGVPVFHRDGRLFGAVSSVGTIVQFVDKKIDKLVERTISCARAIEKELVN